MENKGDKTKTIRMFNKIGVMLIVVYFIIVQVTTRSETLIGYVGEDNLIYVLLLETVVYVLAIFTVGTDKKTYRVEDV